MSDDDDDEEAMEAVAGGDDAGGPKKHPGRIDLAAANRFIAHALASDYLVGDDVKAALLTRCGTIHGLQSTLRVG